MNHDSVATVLILVACGWFPDQYTVLPGRVWPIFDASRLHMHGKWHRMHQSRERAILPPVWAGIARRTDGQKLESHDESRPCAPDEQQGQRNQTHNPNLVRCECRFLCLRHITRRIGLLHGHIWRSAMGAGLSVGCICLALLTSFGRHVAA
ncbi:hypothetical protein, variant 1 [Cryptococcus amylolentus CBS 6039]|uniref:Uncharacterized protein n=1 Tax=Cryptococcus amylolentus CBS 6039 TaxID=1295533 RepID=A0A1E3IAQ9_9TREE|nr:hypothetical protein, variant 1 [Cryptococcus amylolentus CBS 6039]ODN84986.1 hypothetical protein, variant 1 [Cryptococcus amylolentus CBS 6039]